MHVFILNSNNNWNYKYYKKIKYTYLAQWCQLNGRKIQFPALFHLDSAQIRRVCCICQYNRKLLASFFIFSAPPHFKTVISPGRRLTEQRGQLTTPRAAAGFVNKRRCLIATFHPMPHYILWRITSRCCWQSEQFSSEGASVSLAFHPMTHYIKMLLTVRAVQLWGCECIIRAGAMPIRYRFVNINKRHFAL